MASPQVRTVEYDLTKRVPSFNGMIGLAIGDFEKGSTTERMFVTRQDEVDKRLGRPGPASSDAYYVLHSFLTKSQRCWVKRVTNMAKYSGVVVGSAFHVVLGTGNGTLTNFAGILPFARCMPDTVSIYVDKDKVGYDTSVNGTFGGAFSGSHTAYNIVEATSTVNYATGVVTIDFTTAPPTGAKIYARWGLPTIDFVANDATDEVLLSPTSYDWNSRELQLELQPNGKTYTATLLNPLFATESGAVQADARLKVFDNGLLVAWGNSAGSIENATGVTFIDTGTAHTVDYTTGVLTFKAVSGYRYAGPITVTYAKQLVNTTLHTNKVYADTVASIPVTRPVTGAVQAGTTVGIYDGVLLAAWVDSAGVVTNASGVAFLAAATKTFDYTTGAVAFTIHADYTVLGTVTIKYYTAATATPAVGASKVYSDILPPFPVSAPPLAVTSEATATVKIYDGTTLCAYADEDGLLVDVVTGFLASGSFTVNYSTGVIAFNVNAGYTITGIITAKYASELADSCIIYADSEGEWGDKNAIMINDIDIPNNTFKANVYERVHLGGGIYTESMTGESYILSSEEKLDGYNKQLFMDSKVNGKSYYIRVMANQSSLFSTNALANDTLPHNAISYSNTALVFFTGGDDGLAVSVANYIVALQSFQNKEDVDINIIMDTLGDKAYQLAIAQFSDRELFAGRGDCYGVIHTPLSVEEPTNYINSLLTYRKYELAFNSSFVGLYTGHLKIYDTYNGRERWIPPSGFVSAAFSYTADQYDAWWPAAGWARGSLPVLDVYRRFTLGERDILYDNEINVMRYRPGKGIAIWGQKTLYSVPSALDRANVRWLLIVMEKGIESLLEYQEFELNDAYTRNLIRVAIMNYLKNIKARRGLYDFDVVCDDTNNTPEEIDNYKLNVDTYVQPVKAIEYIYSRIVITRTGATFGDIRIQ